MITAITTCVNFGDYLEETLKRNRDFFDHFLVISSPEDRRSQLAAVDGRAELILTRAHEGQGFNRGKMINVGIDAIQEGWICSFDADIILPKDLKLQFSGLDPKCIYGIHRRMCNGKESWQKYVRSGSCAHMPIEAIRKSGFHTPVGFFQMWHSERRLKFPEDFHTASTSDLAFGSQFSPFRRVFINVVAIHLSVAWKRGQDHRGRLSPLWR